MNESEGITLIHVRYIGMKKLDTVKCCLRMNTYVRRNKLNISLIYSA